MYSEMTSTVYCSSQETSLVRAEHEHLLFKKQFQVFPLPLVRLNLSIIVFIYPMTLKSSASEWQHLSVVAYSAMSP